MPIAEFSGNLPANKNNVFAQPVQFLHNLCNFCTKITKINVNIDSLRPYKDEVLQKTCAINERQHKKDKN